MSHLEHIFVSINGSWTDKISPPVILPTSLVKVKEHITLFWDEKGRQRQLLRLEYQRIDVLSKNSYGLQKPAQNSALYWLQVGILCLFLLIIHFHFSINSHGILSWFYQGRDLWSTFEGELESSRVLLLPRYMDSVGLSFAIWVHIAYVN